MVSKNFIFVMLVHLMFKQHLQVKEQNTLKDDLRSFLFTFLFILPASDSKCYVFHNVPSYLSSLALAFFRHVRDVLVNAFNAHHLFLGFCEIRHNSVQKSSHRQHIGDCKSNQTYTSQHTSTISTSTIHHSSFVIL